jgi:hypothetical protein
VFVDGLACSMLNSRERYGGMKKVIIGLIVLALAGCNLSNAIVGQWEVSSTSLWDAPGMVYAFNSDGTVVINPNTAGAVTGIYSIAGGNLVTTFMGIVKTRGCSIVGSVMTWSWGSASWDEETLNKL